MNSKKIIELKLIENGKKSRTKITDDINVLRNDLYSSIDNLIEYEFVNIPCNESLSYLKTNLVSFVKMYINLNRNIKNLNENNYIIQSILDQMINDVIYRCETLKNKDNELIKIIDNTKKEKDKMTIEKITLLE